MNLRAWSAALSLGGLVCLAIILGGPLDDFLDSKSLVFVVGVTIAGTLLSFPWKVIAGAFGLYFGHFGGPEELTEDQGRQVHAVFRRVGQLAVAAGVLGTLVGLVLMLQNLDDPNAIGPAMAVAMLPTFYGVFLGEVVLRCMASDCLGRAGLAEPTTSRRGSASLYLMLSATLIILLSFFIVIYSISSSGEPQEGADPVESTESTETHALEAE